MYDVDLSALGELDRVNAGNPSPLPAGPAFRGGFQLQIGVSRGRRIRLAPRLAAVALHLKSAQPAVRRWAIVGDNLAGPS